MVICLIHNTKLTSRKAVPICTLYAMYVSVILVLLCWQLGLIFSVIACYEKNALRGGGGGGGEGGQWGKKRTSVILSTIKINKKKKNDYSCICLSLITNEVHICCHGFIHLHFFYEFPVYVLSQLALVPWSCLYVNYKVGKRWKEEDEAIGHCNMVPHLWRRWRLKMPGSLSLLEAGCPPSSWGAPGL